MKSLLCRNVVFIAVMVSCLSLKGQYTSTNWVAINDHHRGVATSPYANLYNPFGDDAGLSGFLTNTVSNSIQRQGTKTPVSIVIVNNGAGAGDTMGAPNVGTPAANWFSPYVDFGSGNRDAIQLQGASTVTYTFNGLDSTKRYIFKGTAARGASYSDRWTLVTLNGINSFTHSHTPTWAQGSAPNYG
ncbi:MAG TPA: hypothetical protein PLW02_11605, partial [Verrucomicrobiota bacterium]|nr:hypothetical protein [Verrucomicrobiota bacterium]